MKGKMWTYQHMPKITYLLIKGKDKKLQSNKYKESKQVQDIADKVICILIW